MSNFDYDLFTIGAGSGGVRASRLAASYGAKVCVAEEYRAGGTCVIRGCVPKKLFVYASHYSEDFEDAEGFGWTINDASFDWKKLVANKDKEIDRLEGIYQTVLGNAGAEFVQSRAVLKDAHTVHLVDENRDVTAEKILIATGGTPWLPSDLPGVDHAITSNEAFHLEEFPKRIVVVGGGYIAVEFAGIFKGMGADVTLVHRRDQVLKAFDEELGDTLLEEMKKKGVGLSLGRTITSIALDGETRIVTLDDGSKIEADQVMFAVGRVPNTDGIGIDKVGVELGRGGQILVDEYSRTNIPHIFAVGDVTDRLQLTPVAIREGAAFAETEFNNNPQAMDHRTVATAIFSQPPIGTVGLSEAEALDEFGEIDVYKSSFRTLKHTLTDNQEKTMMKLLVDPKSDKVLGCHIIGPDSGEMIQCLGIAVKMGATKRDFDATVAVHPTSSEELVTMRDKVTKTKSSNGTVSAT